MNTDREKTVDSMALPQPVPAFQIEGELTIYTVADWLSRITSAFGAGAERSVAMELSRITEIDTAGVQLLLMAHRMAVARDGRVQLTAPSSSVRDMLRLCKLDRLICEDSTAEPPTPRSDAA